MTFEEWWDQNCVYLSLTTKKVDFRAAWEASAKSAREACAEICKQVPLANEEDGELIAAAIRALKEGR